MLDKKTVAKIREADDKRLNEALEKCAAYLSEFCTAVQIVCTKNTKDDTDLVYWGSGDKFARLKAVESWAKMEQEQLDLNLGLMGVVGSDEDEDNEYS
jgi:hypothetical protein